MKHLNSCLHACSRRLSRRKDLVVALAALGMASTCQLSFGQAALPPDATQDGQKTASTGAKDAVGSVQLDRVEVTAGKRRQRQQDVAATVSAVQGAALEAAGAKDMEAVFKETPGVQTNKGDPNQALPTIRGVGTVVDSAALGFQQGTTGVYIQDVPFTDPVAFVVTADLAPFDLDRIEVLRGPQGALYGSASLGGAVRYVVNQPDLATTQFSALSSLASVSHGGVDRSVYAMANLPVVDKVSGLRVVLFDRQDSGYIDNIGTGRDHANDLHQTGGRIIGAWQLAPGTRLSAMFMSQTTRIGDSFAVSPDPSRLEINTPTASPRTSKFTLGNVQLDVSLADYTLTSNTGYIEKNADAQTDQTRRAGDIGTLLGLPSLPVVTGRNLSASRSISQEFRIASPSTDRANYVAGVFFQRTLLNVDALWAAPGGESLWGAAVLPNDTLLTELDHASAYETAFFADGEYRISDSWTLGLGGRYYRNRSSYQSDSSLIEAVLGPSSFGHHFAENGFTPKASIKYRFGENTWYALISEGYRFGGVNAVSGTPYSSDKLWNYETGLRLQPARGFTLDLTTFYLDWKDAQVNARQGGDLPINGIANVGKATIKGLEAATQWKPLNELQFNASIAYTRAETASAFTSNSGAIVPTGTRMPGTPKLQSFLQASYLFAGPADTSGRASLTHSFTGQRALSIDSGGQAGAYGQWDVRVAFSTDRWELGLFVANAADKRGIAGGAPVQTFGGSSYTDYYLIKPRTIGATLRFDM